MVKFLKLLKNQDLFGHQINLNFYQRAEEGDLHKTLVGGIISIIIKASMAFYVYYNFKKLFWHEDDKQFNEFGLLNLDELGVVNYTETSQFVFFTLSKQLDRWAPMYLADVDTYLDISFQ